LEVALLTMQALGKPGRNQFAMTDWALYGMQDLNPLPPIDSMPYFGAAFTGHAPGTDLDYFIPQTLVPDAILLPEGEKLTWYGHVVAGLPRADQYNSYQYPREGASRIHMFWTDTPCWSTCWNGGNRIHDALRDPSIEFMLVQHPWLENDTYYADIILPVSTLFEQTDVGTAKMCLENDIALYKDQAVLPVGEAKTDSETVLAIAEKLGKAEELMEHWCYPKSAPKTLSKTRSYYSGVTKINEEKYPYGEPSFETLAKIGFYKGGFSKYMEFDEFKEKGYLPIPFKDDDSWKEARGGLYNFYADPENNPLDTPSGKIEFYSTALAQVWGDDPERPPVPHWIEESESHHERLTNDRGKDYPFLLVSNHPHFRHHAMLDDVAWFRELDICKVDGPDGYKYEPVWMNPADARRRGLKNGDIVRLYNERGSVLGGLLVTERIMENTLSQDHGARVDGIVRGSGGLDRGGANNLICPGKTTSKNAAGEVTNGFLVNVEKVDVFELAKQYPEEFGRDYRPEDGMQATARIVKEV
jgi:trimethylamine-N-oxide reductase (cytochrome c)